MNTLPQVPAPFQLNATVVSNHDGDTIEVVVDWGKRRYEGSPTHPQPIRLLGCNLRELDEPGGVEARDHVAILLPAGAAVVLMTVADDKFAPRWDCGVVYQLPPHLVLVPAGAPRDLVTDLVLDGWAAPWNGRGTKPVPPWPRTNATVEHRLTRLAQLNLAVTEWRGI